MIRAVVVAWALLCAAASPAAASGTWESRPPAPLPRQEAAFAELGGRLHLVGGFEQGGADSARHEIFDIAAGAWSPSVPLPEPMHHVQAAALDGRLYVAGGLQTLGFAVSGRMWMFDPAAGVWSLRAGVPRGGGVLVAAGGRLLYLGGLDASGAAVAAVDAYDPAADSWSPAAPMPTARDHHGAAVVGDTLYVVGGRQAAFGTEVAVTEAMDLRTGAWRGGLAGLPVLRAGFATGAVGDEVIVIGGESADGVHGDVHAFHPGTNTWRRLADMPVPRHGIQGAVVGPSMWVAGGGVDLLVGATDALDVFTPGARPGAALLAPVVAPPAPGASPVASAPRLTLRVVSAKRRRVVVEVSAACRLELRDRRNRVVARARARRGGRVGLRVKRAGRYVVVAREGSQVVRRRVSVRR